MTKALKAMGFAIVLFFSTVAQAQPSTSIITSSDFPYKEVLVFDEQYTYYEYTLILEEASYLSFRSTEDVNFFGCNNNGNYCFDGRKNMKRYLPSGVYSFEMYWYGKGDFVTEITIDFAEPLSFENMTLPVNNKQLNFNSSTPVVIEDYDIEIRGFLYEFEITQTSLLNFKADQNVYFLLCKDAYLNDCQNSESEYSAYLTNGTYYLAVADAYIGGDFTVNITATRTDAQTETAFTIKEMTLPFASALYFHPDYNARLYNDGKYSVYEKVYTLNLDKETTINYVNTVGDSLYLYITTLEGEYIASYWSGDIFKLPAGNYNIHLHDYSYYFQNGKYLSAFIKFEEFAGYDFTEINIPFDRQLTFDSNTPRVNGNRSFLYKFTLSEGSVLSFKADNYFSVHRDDLLQDYVCDGYDVVCSFSAGTYYLRIRDERGGNYNINVEIKEFAGYDFTQISIPFNASLNFNNAPYVRGNRAFLYQFTLDEATSLSFSSGGSSGVCGTNVQLYSDPILLEGKSISTVTALNAGTYYLMVYGYGSPYYGCNSANISIGKQEKETFAIKDMTLNFYKNLYFHPDYNSREAWNDSFKGVSVIEKAFRLVLEEETLVRYGYSGNGWPRLCAYTDEYLDEIKECYWNNTFTLPAGIHYLAFNDDGYYNNYYYWKENEYLHTSVSLEKLVFAEMEFPFNQTLSFANENTINIGGNRAYTYKFTLENPATLDFNADNVGFTVYRNADLSNEVGDGWDNYSADFTSGTYYLAIRGNSGSTTNVTINKTEIQPETFSIVNMSLPFSKNLIFQPGYNSREGDNGIEKVFKLVLGKAQRINYDAENWSPLYIYSDDALTKLVYVSHPWNWSGVDTRVFTLQAGTYYLAFTDDYRYEAEGYYFANEVSLEGHEPYVFTGISIPFDEELTFNYENNYSHLLEFTLDKPSVLSFSGNYVYFNLYRNSELSQSINSGSNFETALATGTYYLRLSPNAPSGMPGYSVKSRVAITESAGYDFAEIELPFNASLDFSNAPYVNGYRAYLYKIELDEASIVSFNIDSYYYVEFYLYSDPLLLDNIDNGYYTRNLNAGTYYLMVRGDYYSMANISIAKSNFTKIEFPFNASLDFSTAPVVNGYSAYLYKIELDEAALVIFNSDQAYFHLYRDPSLQDNIYDGWGGFTRNLDAGTYYLMVRDVGYSTANISISKLEKEAFAITDITLNFSENLYFHPDYNSRVNLNSGYIEKAFRLVLEEETLVRYSSGNGWPRLCTYTDESLDEIKNCYWDNTLTLPVGIHYLAFNDGNYNNKYGYYLNTIVHLEKLVFTEMAFNFNQTLSFANENTINFDGGRAHTYTFTLANPATLDFNADNNAGFIVYRNADLSDYIGSGWDNYSADFAAGTYYLAIRGNSGSTTNVTVNKTEISPEPFRIVNIQLPFSADLVFHPDYNSRVNPNGGYIEKVFKLVLDKEQRINYNPRNGSPLYIYSDEALNEQVHISHPWSNTSVFTLQAGTYYLAFTDNNYYNSNGQYFANYVSLEGNDPYIFTEIALPYDRTLTFNYGNKDPHLLKFTLDKPSIVNFNGNEVYFNLYENPELSYGIGGGNWNFETKLAAGTYYLRAEAWYTTSRITINATEIPPYVITGDIHNGFTATLGTTWSYSSSSIQSLMHEIRYNANYMDCEIQFGDGGVLDIGDQRIYFDYYSWPQWGKVTLSGNITSTSASGSTILNESHAIILNGTVSAPANGIAILNSGHLILSGSPTINGAIEVGYYGYGELSVSDDFEPEAKTYTLAFNSYYNHSPVTLVKGGAAFISNFALADNGYRLVASGNDLVAEIACEANEILDDGVCKAASIVTFNFDNGAPLKDVKVVQGSTIAAQSIGGIAKTGFINDGKWYLNDTEFNFAMPVYDNITLSLKWEAAEVTVTPATLADGVFGVLYEQQLNAVTENNAGGTITFALKNGSLPNGLELFANGIISGTPKLAGGPITFTVEATNAASGATGEGTFSISIAKATPSYAVPTGLIATYGANLSSVSLTSGWAWESTGTVGNAGTQTHKATFTPSDVANYNIVTGIDVEVAVSKATPTITTLPIAETVTYGATLLSSSLTGGEASVEGVFAWETLSAVPTVGNAGYAVVFTPSDTDNYNTVEITIAITVNKATPSYTVPTGLTATYGANLSSVSLTSGWAWESTGTVGNAGTQTHKAKFTPADAVNYNIVTGIDVTISVSKATPTITANPVATAVTIGEALSSSALTGGEASIAGTFAWKTPSTVPTIGNTGYIVIFTPSDTDNYNTVERTIAITVNKLPLTITAWPTAESVTYGATLSSSALTGGAASVAGTFAWKVPSTVPTVGNTGYVVEFIPKDTDYETMQTILAITVSKAKPTITTNPVAAAVTIGATLSSSALTGGAANVPGTFVWKTPSTVPTVSNAGYAVVFTPTDDVNYETTETRVAIMVNKLKPTIIAWPTAETVTYGATLSSSALTGGVAGVDGAFAWEMPSTVPTVVNGGYAVVFTPENVDYETVRITIAIIVNRLAKTTVPDIASVEPTITSTTITFPAMDGIEFSKDGGSTWQGPAFTDLTPDTEYAFLLRYKETATHFASEASAEISFKTLEDKPIQQIVNPTECEDDEELDELGECIVSPIAKSFAAHNLGILKTGESFLIQGLTRAETVRIVDVKGKMLMSRTVMPNESVSISHLPKGMYLVNVNGKAFRMVK